jgi:hypothetical protein
MPAPLGNQNAAKGKIWHHAIMRALRKRSKSDQIEALDELAEKLLELVEAGDLGALKEFGDRLDGKPAQAITGDGGGALVVRLSHADEDV